MALNEVFDYGVQFDVAASTIDAPASPTSSDAVVIGQLPAVAQTDPFTNNAGESRITVKTNGVHDLDVTGAAGAIAVGDLVYIATADGALSNTNTGVRYGYALGAVANAATTNIPVKIGY